MADAHAEAHAHGDAHVHIDTHHDEPAHASRRTYWIVAGVLGVITAIEVAIFFVPAIKEGGMFVPALLGLSLLKFMIVVQFFMHLRYDNKVFSRVFFGPLCLAVLVVTGMILLFKWLPKFAW